MLKLHFSSIYTSIKPRLRNRLCHEEKKGKKHEKARKFFTADVLFVH